MAALVLVPVCAAVFLLPGLWSATVRAFVLSLAPLALLTVFAVMYSVRYGSPITAGLIQGLVFTDMRVELEEGGRYWWAIAASLAAFALYLRVARRIRPAPFALRKPAAAAALSAVLVLIYAPYVCEWLWMQYDRSIKDSVLKTGYPQSIFFSVLEAWQTSRTVKENDRVDIRGQYGLAPPPASGRRDVYVLIIGESAREATWHELESGFNRLRANVVRYRDALSQANWTRLSVPLMTTGARRREDVATLPTITDWQRWAGCATASLSNNASFPYSRGADIKTIVGEYDGIRYNRYDHDLLPMLEQLLDAKKPGSVCVTLHMIGSHQKFPERYERRFARFDTGGGNDLESMRNEYRNTIVMTQDFVNRVIEILEREAGGAFLAFSSDHGENLLEINGLREHVTMTPTEYELNVPMLFWANDRFIREHAGAWSALKENSRLPVTNVNLLPTVLDAMGILGDAHRVYPYAPSLMRTVGSEYRFYYDPSLELHPEADMLKDRR